MLVLGASTAHAQVTGPARGGTGLSTPPTYGQVLVGNALGGYTLTATSSLGIVGGGGGSSSWGGITGTLSNQTDLQAALNAKFSLAAWFATTTAPHLTSLPNLTLAYSQLSGTPTIPTNNNQLTNGAGYITGNQTITLSGDVTGSGTTGITTAYNNVVPASKGGAGTISGLLKANGSGTVSAAVNGTDFTLITAKSCPGGDFVSSVTAAGVFTCTTPATGTTYTGTYPIQITGSVISSALSTTSSNTWGGTQTFTSVPRLASLTGLVAANGGVLYQVASSSLFGFTPASNATTLTINGTANEITSSAGAQDLSANRTWTLSLPTHVIQPSFFATGASTTNATTTGSQYFSFITGSAQCLQVDTNGKLSGTGSVCGSGAGSVSSIAQTSGTAQTGAITFATSSASSNGQTHGLNITNTSGAFTFTPTLSGVLTEAGGGTGSTTFGTAFYNYFRATTTDALAEGGTNQYWTPTRFDARLTATTTLPALTTLVNLGTVKTSLTGLLKASSGVLSAAVAGTDYEVPLTVSGGLTRTANNIAPTSGFNIPLTASTTNWAAFYDAPSNRITDGTGLTWSGNTLNCDTASGSVQGCLSSADWTTFNNKGNGTVTSVTGTYPVVSSGGATPAISLAFGTTTSNTWAGTQTFTNSPVFSSLTGGLVSSNASSDTLYNTATTTLAGTGVISISNSPVVMGASGAVASLTGGANGQVLGWASGAPAWVATTTFSGGLTYAAGNVTADLGTSITVGELASADFGSFTCNGSACTIDTGAVSNAMLANSTISGVALGGTLGALTATDSTLTFSGSYTGGAARTVGLNLGNANTWSALQQFSNASSTQFSAYLASFGSTATTTISANGSVALPAGAALTIPDMTSALLQTSGSGVVAEYAGTSCTNQFVRSLSALGVATCATVANTDLANSSVSYGGVSVSLGSSNATPAFNLSSATSLPIVAGTTGTLTVARGGTGLTTFGGTNTILYTTAADSLSTEAAFLYDSSANRLTVDFASTTAVSGTNSNWSGILLAARHIISGITASFSPSVEGEIGIDTTDNQFKFFSGGAVRVVSPTLYPAFSYATSTAWTGTTTIPIGPAYVGETWSGVKCFTDTGTLNVSFNDGTNRMDMLNASTTVGTFSLTTNNAFTVSEKRYVDIGTPASSPTKISCTVAKVIDPT